MSVKCGVALLLVGCFAGFFAVSSAQADRCEPGWSNYGDSCYFRVAKNKKTWQKALSHCQNMQADLVTVNNEDEMEYLKSIFGKFGSWCGLNNKDDKNTFVWQSGEQSDYTNWDQGQPMINNQQRCVHIMLRREGYMWEMSKCSTKFRYTCEKDAGPPPSPCSSNPCKNGGTCIEEGDSYRCQCPGQFTGPQCETEIVVDPCDSNPCMNGGTCTSTGDMFSCACTDQFTGDRCETSLDPCDPNPCQNGGTCLDYSPNYQCVCEYGFGGDNCEKLLCSAYPCQNGGTCLELEDDTTICLCESGFVGTTCEGEVPIITKNPQDTIRMEGDDATLCCEATGSPKPTIEWFKDGVLINGQSGETLSLEDLSAEDAGSYKCRAQNEFGKVFSSDAELTVVSGAGQDSCNPNPLTKIETLPPGCTEDSSGNNNVDVGTCSNDACAKRSPDDGSCGGQLENPLCCTAATTTDSPVSCGNGNKFTIPKTLSCACKPCIVQSTLLHGRVVDPEGNAVSNAEVTVAGGERPFTTDGNGNFDLEVEPGTKRLVITVRDIFGKKHMDTTKVFTLQEGQISFYTIVVQKKPSVIKFSSRQEQNIPLGEEGGKPSFVDLDVPADAFLTEDGSVYDGEISASIALIDPRSQADMAAAPGDFSAIDDNGEELMLATAGIMRPDFTDASGNKLSLGKNITVRLDFDMLQIPEDVTVFQWYLSQETGRWVKFGVLREEEGGSRKKRQNRRFFVSDLTPNIPMDAINWDYVSVVSHVRVVAPPGTVVTRIGGTAPTFTSYTQATVPASGVLCIRSRRDQPAVLQAELNGAPLIPVQPVNFPQVVNPTIIDGSSTGNTFKIQSFQFTSTKATDSGPVYLKGEESRCNQRGASDLAFEFQSAVPGETFHWESPVPRGANWYPTGNPNQLCYIKVVVSGARPESVIFAKSTQDGSSVEYGYTAEKATMVGSQGVTCLEYRCNAAGQSQVWTHLQVYALTNTCSNMRASGNLAGTPCTGAGSSGAEVNFCIPLQLSGSSAGLYSGNPTQALFRCQAGDQTYNAGQPQPNVNGPTVEVDCN